MSCENTCCICQDAEGCTDYSILPCGHKAHSACLVKWLVNYKQNCPLCRSDICKRQDDHVTSEDSEDSEDDEEEEEERQRWSQEQKNLQRSQLTNLMRRKSIQSRTLSKKCAKLRALRKERADLCREIIPIQNSIKEKNQRKTQLLRSLQKQHNHSIRQLHHDVHRSTQPDRITLQRAMTKKRNINRQMEQLSNELLSFV